MTTTIEIPEEVAALAKEGAAKYELDLPEFLTQAIEEKARRKPNGLRYYVNGVDMGPFDPRTLGPPPPPEVVARRKAASETLNGLREEGIWISDLMDDTYSVPLEWRNQAPA
ncbi:hypothetical protein AXK11_05115 [Cephaloticoccus primus]|uniref:Uncharacterized protein n=1 Tax=Cephaloticoccus primus TaxID=1548207 RepID=A0A139SN19_9BACT|nr:hypothetical protein [Cephaloticoccus primus]KXU35911.1 hypothetical protein AXK11_05115 [Cephaloticoccus primus]